MTESTEKVNGYELSRGWWNFCFENPELITPAHTAVYFFAIEHCNRLGWKRKFGLPTTMCMEAIGIKSYNTYKKVLEQLVEWGFIKMIEKSKNQYSSNIVALSKFDKALYKALDKALTKHATKQSESTIQSIVSIDKQYNQEPINQEPTTESEEIESENSHEVFAEKLLSDSGSKNRAEICMQAGFSQIKAEWVQRFNAHLGTENKNHYHYNEWLKHFRSWLLKVLPELRKQETQPKPITYKLLR